MPEEHPTDPNDSTRKSITRWIRDLEGGDDEAARLLWGEYFNKLVAIARRQLGDAGRRVADEEDVAISVFRCLCAGAQNKQFSNLNSRDELWRLLVVITNHKVIDQRRWEGGKKRGGGRVRGDSALNRLAEYGTREGFDQLVGDSPTPEFLAMLAEQHQRLMQQLASDTLRTVALRKMEGYNNEEIGKELGLARRSIQRKLGRIRQVWLAEIES